MSPFPLEIQEKQQQTQRQPQGQPQRLVVRMQQSIPIPLRPSKRKQRRPPRRSRPAPARQPADAAGGQKRSLAWDEGSVPARAFGRSWGFREESIAATPADQSKRDPQEYGFILRVQTCFWLLTSQRRKFPAPHGDPACPSMPIRPSLSNYGSAARRRGSRRSRRCS